MPRWMAGGSQQMNLDHLFDTNTIGPNDNPFDVYTRYMMYWPGISLSVFTKKFNNTMKAKHGTTSGGGESNVARSDSTAQLLTLRPFAKKGVATSTAAVAGAGPGMDGIPTGE